MEEQRVPLGPNERPPTSTAPATSADGRPASVEPSATGGTDANRAIDDPRALTILTTEHWSLLSHRALVYNEAFARAGMFLTFLSATLVALGLISTATGFSREFHLIAAVLLALDLFIGLATMGRMRAALAEDLRCLQGMNRLRHAYHEIVPGLEPFFVFGKHDDVTGVFAVYGQAPALYSLWGIVHGFTTAIGMVGVICSTVAAVLAGVIVLLLTADTGATGLTALVVFAAGVVLQVRIMTRSVVRLGESLAPVFPSPRAEGDR